MTTINRAKAMIGINPCYDIYGISFHEVQKARTIFLGALAQYHGQEDMSSNEVLSCTLATVWHAAKQYYAQHPEELHREVLL